MRLPWVSRAVHEAECAVLRETLAAEREMHRVVSAQYGAYQDQQAAEIVSLRAQIATLLDRLTATQQPVVPHEPLTVAPPREPSVIDAVIRMEAKGDQRLARYYRSRARTLKEEHPHWNDQQVAQELSRWETAEEMAPEFLVGADGLTPNEQVS